jgi:hypothetical protein
MVACATVNVGSNVAGIRWYELRSTGTTWSVYQQGTFSPDSHSRWMGSIAMDDLGNIAVGYSISSTTMYPSIRYTGRVASDPLNEMTVGEHGIANGTGYQSYGGSGNMRWGDYSDMCVDPSASGTFWYTQMYYTSNGTNWKTRIASFNFSDIFSVTASATPSTICSGQTTQLNSSATGGSGTFTYSWTSNPPGFTSTLQNPTANPTVTTDYIVAANDGTTTKTATTTVTVNGEPTADAGPDVTYPNTTPMFPVSGTTTFSNSLKWTTAGDGHYNIDTVAASLYYPGPLDKSTGGVNLTLTAYPIAPCVNPTSDVVHVTLSFPAGIGDNSSAAFGVTLSPNPSNGLFTLTIHGVRNTEARITVSDLAGKEIYTENAVSATSDLTREVNMAGNPKGIYLVKVTTNQQSVTKKLVLQ